MKKAVNPFEMRAFNALKRLLVAEKLGLLPQYCRITSQQAYFSRDRGANIIFDIAIELTLPKMSNYALVWLWECKNYTHRVSVDNIEEFYSKVTQVTGLNTKAGIITSTALQAGALSFAKSKKISVVRLLPESQVFWENAFTSLPQKGRNSASRALIEPRYRAYQNDCFIFDDDKFFDSPAEYMSYLYAM